MGEILRWGSLCVALAILELAMQTKLASNSQTPPASASYVLGLQVCAPPPRLQLYFSVCIESTGKQIMGTQIL